MFWRNTPISELSDAIKQNVEDNRTRENKKIYHPSEIKDLFEYIKDEIAKNYGNIPSAIDTLKTLNNVTQDHSPNGGHWIYKDAMTKENRIQCAALMSYMCFADKSAVQRSGINPDHWVETMALGCLRKDFNNAFDEIHFYIKNKKEENLKNSFNLYLASNNRDFSDGYLYEEVFTLDNPGTKSPYINLEYDRPNGFRISENTENTCLDALVDYGNKHQNSFFSENLSSTVGQLLKHSSCPGLTDKEIETCAKIASFKQLRPHKIMDAITEKAMRDCAQVKENQLKQQLIEGYTSVLSTAPEDSDVHSYLHAMCKDRRLRYLNSKVIPEAEILCITALSQAMTNVAQQRPKYADFAEQEIKSNLTSIIGQSLARDYGNTSFSVAAAALRLIKDRAANGNDNTATDYINLMNEELKKNKGAENYEKAINRSRIAECIVDTTSAIIEKHPNCAAAGVAVLEVLANTENNQKQAGKYLSEAMKDLSATIISKNPNLENKCSLTFKKAEMMARINANQQYESKLSGTVIASKIADGINAGIIDAPKTPQEGNMLATQIQTRLLKRKSRS